MANGFKKQALPNSKLAMLLLVVFSMSECASATWPPIGEYKTHVNITNDISQGVTLYLHCKSADDDLGPHVLGHSQWFDIGFHRNWLDRTKFWCSMAWVDSTGTEFHGVGDVYNHNRRKHCAAEGFCVISVRIDGVWNMDITSRPNGMLFPWKKNDQKKIY